MKKVILIIIGLVLAGGIGYFVYTQVNKPEEVIDGKVVFSLFYGDTCPHCQELEEFLKNMDDSYKNKIQLNMYETYKDFGNNALKNKTAKKYNIACEGVPCFFIGEKPFYGYSSAFNEKILNTIDEEYEKKHFKDQVEK